MVKLKGPILSLEASGSLAKTVIVQQNKGRTYMRKLSSPSQPLAAGQVGNRTMFRHLTSHWSDLSAADQATWNPPAEDQNITAFDAYLRENLQRWGIGKDPGNAYPVAEDDSAGVANLIVLLPQGRGVQVAFQLSTIDQNQGFRIHRNIAPGIPASNDNLVWIKSPIGIPADSWFDTPREPDQYWYRLVPFSDHGVTGTPTSELQITVT
jgi:hypothetical protein